MPCILATSRQKAVPDKMPSRSKKSPLTCVKAKIRRLQHSWGLHIPAVRRELGDVARIRSSTSAGMMLSKLRVNPRKSWYRNLAAVTTNGDYEVTFHLN